MKVYIFGLGPSRMAIDPSDRKSGTEYWGLPWDDGRAMHYDRCFEMHDYQALHMPMVRNDDYWEKLREMQMTYVQDPDQWGDLASCVTRYPLQMVQDMVGDYFASSMSYMLALAITERLSNGSVDEIGLYGCELHAEDGFAHERPNIEFFLGFARALGIRLDVSPTSTVFDRQVWQKLGKYPIRYPKRYGWVS